ncbi:phosphoribosylglycinamide formyltransferase 2 [Burkholderia pseudomallei]|nr:phosphoribosylglycinamide formyltransferase 2 [Burkholderia pseudomallei]
MQIGQRLGTPLSPSATRVMLLGAGELGKEVIIALQRLGVEVIAVDRYPNAPGHQVAHRAHVIDMTDPDALRALVDAERPHLVVPEIEAIATDALAAIEAAGVCEVIPTARATQLTMNREGIRRLAAEELGLPTSPYAFAQSFDEFAAAVARIGFPCVVKPVMSSSGKGQSVVRSEADIEPAWRYAMAGGRVNHGRVIVEGFIRFDYEITQLTVRAIDSASGQTRTSFCAPIGHLQVAGDYVESWQPQPMSAKALERSRDIAHRVTSALGGRGIFGVELFVRGDDVWFSEVSPRPHDTGLVTLASQRQSEFELHARDPRPAGRARARDARRVGRDLRRARRSGHRVRGRARRARGAGRRSAAVRQARELREAPDGRRARDGRERRRSARAREAGRRRGASGVRALTSADEC